MQAGDAAAYLALARPTPRTARARAISPRRNSCRARRAPSSRSATACRSAARSPGDGYRLIVDVFVEFGDAGARRDVAARRQAHRPTAGRARVDDRRRRSGCRRSRTSTGCRSTPTKQFAARNLTIAAEDLDLTLAGRIGVRRRHRQGVTGARAARPRRDAVSSRRRRPRRGRSGSSAAARRSRRASTRRSSASNPADFDALVAVDALQPTAGRPARAGSARRTSSARSRRSRSSSTSAI